MKTTAIEKYLKKHLSTCTMHRYSDGDNRKCSCGLDEARAELEAMKQVIQASDMVGAADVIIQLREELAAKDAVVEVARKLLDKCVEHLPEMDNLIDEMGALEAALKALT